MKDTGLAGDMHAELVAVLDNPPEDVDDTLGALLQYLQAQEACCEQFFFR